MNTTDLDPTAPPAEKRWTTHIFQPATQDGLPAHMFNINSSLQLFGTSEDPPCHSFEGVYAGAILYHFGTQELKDQLIKTWGDTFYPGEDCKVINMTSYNKAEACHGPDMFDMLMVLPYIIMPYNKLQATLKGAKKKAQEVKQRCVQKKVNQWIRQVKNAY
jgi:hypothetical protein